MEKLVILILAFIAISILIFGFIGYAVVTTKIIKSQEKEVARLMTVIKRYEQRANRNRVS